MKHALALMTLFLVLLLMITTVMAVGNSKQAQQMAQRAQLISSLRTELRESQQDSKALNDQLTAQYAVAKALRAERDALNMRYDRLMTLLRVQPADEAVMQTLFSSLLPMAHPLKTGQLSGEGCLQAQAIQRVLSVSAENVAKPAASAMPLTTAAPLTPALAPPLATLPPTQTTNSSSSPAATDGSTPVPESLPVPQATKEPQAACVSDSPVPMHTSTATTPPTRVTSPSSTPAATDRSTPVPKPSPVPQATKEPQAACASDVSADLTRILDSGASFIQHTLQWIKQTLEQFVSLLTAFSAQ